MSDNVELNSGAGGAILATDDVLGVQFQKIKIDVGGDGATAPLSNSNPIPVSDAGGNLSIDDGGNSITVDNAALSVTGGGVEATALRVTIATDSTGVLSVDDNGGTLSIDDGAGSITIDGTVTANLAAGTNNIGDVDVLTVPADPFGANADAASATGSISAKLRFIASTGIPITGTVTVGSHAVTNAGTFVVQENGSALTALQLIDDTVFADDAAFTVGTSKVNAIGLIADESSTDSIDEGDVGAPRMTLDRKQITTVYAHAAAGGWTPYKNLDCDETEDDIKTAPGKLGWIHVINRSTGVRYIKFYNDTAANVSVGTTTPVLSFPVPTMADTNGAGFTINFGDAGVQFSVAICVAATTGVADNDTGAPGSNDVVLNAGYL